MLNVLYILPSCAALGPVNQTLNIIRGLDNSKYKSKLITIYKEGERSILADYLPYVTHRYVPTSKKDILLSRSQRLDEAIDAFSPDVIHTVGVFPDFAVSRTRKYPHVITLRNYCWDDYPALYGKLRGNALIQIGMYAAKNADKVITCSSSLSAMYEERLGIKFDYIRNGVNTKKFNIATKEESVLHRKKLGLPEKAFLFVCAAPFIKRKNHHELIKAFSNEFSNAGDVGLVLLGDGPELPDLQKQYGRENNIHFVGNADNVAQYLNACDAYVSSSLSEGMPNSVLEAMACGLPLLLSNIPQHMEMLDIDASLGASYTTGDVNALKQRMTSFVTESFGNKERIRQVAIDNLSDSVMSRKYQDVYSKLIKGSSMPGIDANKLVGPMTTIAASQQ